MTRAKISLPLLSVPKGCSRPGDWLKEFRFILSGSLKGSSGKSMESINMKTTKNRGNSALLPLSTMQPYPWIEIMIEHIDKEIDNDKNHSAGYDTSHYNRVVSLDYAFHRKSPDAVPPKNGFCDHSAVQVASEIEADYSYDWNYRIFQDMVY